jgi:hypothetical protein
MVALRCAAAAQRIGLYQCDKGLVSYHDAPEDDLGTSPVPVGNLIRLASEAESRNVSGL